MQRGLSICSCLHSLKGEEDFLACTRLRARRTSSVLACTRSRVTRTFSPALARGRGGLPLFFPALAQGRGGLLLFLPTLAQGRGGLSRLHSLEGEEHFLCSRLHSLKARRTSSVASGRTRALRSLIITGASDRRKTMRSFKLFNYCHRSPKNDGDFKTFN